MQAKLAHQAITKLVSEYPELVPELVRRLLGLDLPGSLESVPVPAPETIRDIQYPEHSADAAVVIRKNDAGANEEAFVNEMQTKRDDEKRWSWPIHVAGLRARLRCPVTLVVIAGNETTAKWAAEPIDLGRGQMVLRPLVIGPHQIPRMLELADAQRHPALATLSVIVHGQRPESKDLGRVAIRAALAMLDGGDGRGTLLFDLIMAFLDAATLEELKEQMELQTTRFSEFARRHYASGMEKGREEGREEGRRRALSLVLRARGLRLTLAQRERVEQCSDGEQLEAWLHAAATVDDAARLFDEQ